MSNAAQWVRKLTGRGLLGGAAHAVMAGLTTFLIEAGHNTSDLPAMLVFLTTTGAAIGVLLATTAGLLTAPAAVRAATQGSWGHMRPWVIGLPVAAIVAAAVTIAPPWPTEVAAPTIWSDLLINAVWLHIGPACWAAWILHQLTADWPDTQRTRRPKP